MKLTESKCDLCGVKLPEYYAGLRCVPCRRRECVSCGRKFSPPKFTVHFERCFRCRRVQLRNRTQIALGEHDETL